MRTPRPGATSSPRSAWSGSARPPPPRELGMRVCMLRTGVVLDASGGALAKMLTPFRLGVGGPVAAGRQYISWIHTEDLLAIALERARGRALERRRSTAPRPAPVENREFSKVLGQVLHRPAVIPVPGFALRAMYGEMAQIVTGRRARRAGQGAGARLRVRHPELEEALRSALA